VAHPLAGPGANGDDTIDPRLRAMRPRDRGPLAELGTHLFSPFGDYSTALPDWLRRPGVWCRVLDDGSGLPAGLALVTVMKGPDKNYQGYLLALGVVESMQRQGWGRRLLEQAIQELHKRKKRYTLEWIRLTVAADNFAAIELFESSGFRPAPNEVEHYEDGQRAISMRKPLD
jgi:ribosomal protein S18 acetylase RimI-like enzyme